MYKILLIAAALGIALSATVREPRCDESPTVVSGSKAPESICSGDLIFQDEFDFLDFKKWQHESTLAGGGVSTYLKQGLPRITNLSSVEFILLKM